MPNLDNLMEQVAEIINSDNQGEIMFTSLDMLDANGQTELHPETARHCNFQIFGGTSYRNLRIQHRILRIYHHAA